MAHHRLEVIQRRFLSETYRLNDTLWRQQSTEKYLASKESAEYCTLALHDAWNRFVRDVVISSTIGGTENRSGNSIEKSKLGLANSKDVLTYLQNNWPGRRQQQWWEPRWHDVGETGKALSILKTANEIDIMGALASSTNPIEELRLVRNFIAHRLPNTAASAHSVAVALGVPGWRQPVDIVMQLLSVDVGVFETVFAMWCRQLNSVARASVT